MINVSKQHGEYLLRISSRNLCEFAARLTDHEGLRTDVDRLNFEGARMDKERARLLLNGQMQVWTGSPTGDSISKDPLPCPASRLT